MNFFCNLSVYDNDITPHEVVEMARNTATTGFTGWKKYTPIQVDQAILNLPIEHCQEVTRVFIKFYIFFYPYSPKPVYLDSVRHTDRQTDTLTFLIMKYFY